MNLLEWNEEYSVKIGKIDEQHKKLLDFINRLFDAMHTGRGNEVISEILDGLTIYTVNHFRTEEQLMISHSYSDFEIHKNEHQSLVNKLNIIKAKHRKGHQNLSSELSVFLKKWLITHILCTDKIMARYLQNKGIK